LIALLGSDGSLPVAGRTDSIILAFLQREAGRASLVSVPRDLYVYQPGIGMQRINTALQTGGEELLLETIEYNLGVRPQHWILTDFDGFIHLVDDLGGIDVLVTRPLPEDCFGVPSGKVHMNGHVALCYARSRFSTDDFDRSRRQQEVLRALLRRLLSPDALASLPARYERFRDSFQTDLAWDDIAAALPFAMRLQQNDGITYLPIGWDQVSLWQEPQSGATVLLPQPIAIRAILEQALALLDAPG